MLDSSIQRIQLRIVCSEMKLRLVTPNRMHSVDFLSSAWQPLFSQLVSSSTYHNSFVYWRQQKAAKIIKNLGRIDESHTNLLWKRISKYPNTKYTYTRRNATSGIPSGSECSSSESERENTAQQLKMVASLAPTAANSKNRKESEFLNRREKKTNQNKIYSLWYEQQRTEREMQAKIRNGVVLYPYIHILLLSFEVCGALLSALCGFVFHMIFFWTIFLLLLRASISWWIALFLDVAVCASVSVLCFSACDRLRLYFIIHIWYRCYEPIKYALELATTTVSTA